MNRLRKNSVLVVGLGNPGAEFNNTRHNAGFEMLDYLSGCYQVNFVAKPKFSADIASYQSDNIKVLLCKPQTFMNCSGKSVLSIVSFYRLKPEDILVIHDDLDIKIGRVKYKKGGGSAGHNGIKSISSQIGPNYHRIRIGIKNLNDIISSVSDFVLNRFISTEHIIMQHVLEATVAALPSFYSGNIELFKQNLNLIKQD